MVHKCWFTLRIEILVNFYNILVNYGQNQEIFQEKCNFLEEISWSLISCFLVFYQEMCNSISLSIWLTFTGRGKTKHFLFWKYFLMVNLILSNSSSSSSSGSSPNPKQCSMYSSSVAGLPSTWRSRKKSLKVNTRSGKYWASWELDDLDSFSTNKNNRLESAKP